MYKEIKMVIGNVEYTITNDENLQKRIQEVLTKNDVVKESNQPLDTHPIRVVNGSVKENIKNLESIRNNMNQLVHDEDHLNELDQYINELYKVDEDNYPIPVPSGATNHLSYDIVRANAYINKFIRLMDVDMNHAITELECYVIPKLHNVVGALRTEDDRKAQEITDKVDYLIQMFEKYEYAPVSSVDGMLTVVDLQEKDYTTRSKTIDEWIQDFKEQERNREEIIKKQEEEEEKRINIQAYKQALKDMDKLDKFLERSNRHSTILELCKELNGHNLEVEVGDTRFDVNYGCLLTTIRLDDNGKCKQAKDGITVYDSEHEIVDELLDFDTIVSRSLDEPTKKQLQEVDRLEKDLLEKNS